MGGRDAGALAVLAVEGAIAEQDVVGGCEAERGGGGVDPGGRAFEFQEGADGGLVEDGVSGLVVEPTPAAVAAAIDELWATRARWRRMGETGRTRALQVSWDPVVEQLVAAA